MRKIPEQFRHLFGPIKQETLKNLRENIKGVKSNDRKGEQRSHIETEKVQQITFYFTAHETAADFDGLEPYLAGADSIYYEQPGWTKERWQHFQRIAQKGAKAEISDDGSFQAKFLQAIENSDKEIIFFDIPRNSDIYQAEVEARKQAREAIISFWEGQFDTALEKMREILLQLSRLDQQREDYMVENLRRNLSKKQGRVLIILGASHAAVARRLKRFTVETITSRHQMFASAYEEAILKINKSEQVSPELIARICLESALQRFLHQKIQDTNEKDKLITEWLKKLTLSDYRKISQELGKVQGGRAKMQRLRELVFRE